MEKCDQSRGCSLEKELQIVVFLSTILCVTSDFQLKFQVVLQEDPICSSWLVKSQNGVNAALCLYFNAIKLQQAISWWPLTNKLSKSGKNYPLYHKGRFFQLFPLEEDTVHPLCELCPYTDNRKPMFYKIRCCIVDVSSVKENAHELLYFILFF